MQRKTIVLITPTSVFPSLASLAELHVARFRLQAYLIFAVLNITRSRQDCKMSSVSRRDAHVGFGQPATKPH